MPVGAAYDWHKALASWLYFEELEPLLFMAGGVQRVEGY